MPWAHREAQGIHRRDRPEALGQLVHLDHDRADRNTPGKQRPARGDPCLLGYSGLPGHACRGPGLPEDQVNKATPGHRDADDHRPRPLGQVAHLASPGQVDQAPSSKRNRHGQNRYRHGRSQRQAHQPSPSRPPAMTLHPPPRLTAGSPPKARNPVTPHLPAVPALSRRPRGQPSTYVAYMCRLYCREAHRAIGTRAQGDDCRPVRTALRLRPDEGSQAAKRHPVPDACPAAARGPGGLGVGGPAPATAAAGRHASTTS